MGVERVEGDLDDGGALARAARDVTDVVHLAAVFRTRDEAAIWKVNHEGTKNLIAAVLEVAPTARFVLARTSNVYVPDLDRPAREDDPTTTANAYAASKVAAESELRGSGLTWTILRFPFVYGDGDGHLQDTPSVLAEMHAHPAQRFSVLHHDDLASAVKLALDGAMDSDGQHRRRRAATHHWPPGLDSRQKYSLCTRPAESADSDLFGRRLSAETTVADRPASPLSPRGPQVRGFCSARASTQSGSVRSTSERPGRASCFVNPEVAQVSALPSNSARMHRQS